MNRVDVRLDDSSLGGSALVGHLARTPSRSGETISFECAADWRDGRSPVTPFALDPQLALSSGPHYARDGASQLPPAFIDAAPDRWGKPLMDRRESIEARGQARPPRAPRWAARAPKRASATLTARCGWRSSLPPTTATTSGCGSSSSSNWPFAPASTCRRRARYRSLRVATPSPCGASTAPRARVGPTPRR